MKVKSVIVDTTLPSVSTLNPSLWQYNRQNLIDWQIQKILNSGRSAVVVIAEDGDEILRNAKLIDSCDLVFSTEKSPHAGLLAGLHGTGVCAFYLPVEIPFPADAIWTELEKEHVKLDYNHKTHILKPDTDFPWLVTKFGRDTILKTGKIILPDLSLKSLPIDCVTEEKSSTKPNA